MRKQNNYCKAAADWWAKAIEKGSIGGIKNIDSFQEVLTKEIDNTISKQAHMKISTYERRSTVLDTIAYKTGMCADIPNGYEMKISHDAGAYVYDKKGKVVASFS